MMKKNRLRCLAGVLALTALMASAQNKVTVNGRVLDGDDKTPVPQATIQLLSLPDSTMAAGNVSDNGGWFSIAATPGKYVLRVSFVGYVTQDKPVTLAKGRQQLNVGSIMLPTDAIMLGEAVVVAEVPPVRAVEDTLEYNAAAFRTPEGAMLEELVKKIPGAEVGDDGNVKVNGKTVKKLLVEGKEFFGGDVATGLQNLPVDMVDRIKAYDRQSDMARTTGIEDGEEETVLDLTVKKGMNQGWFGNMDLSAGTEERYSERFLVNRFNSSGGNSSQLTMMGSMNNTNDRGFSGGGGGPRFGGGNGLTTSKSAGISFAKETSKLEMGGSARYNYRKNDVQTIGNSEVFRVDNPSQYTYSHSGRLNTNHNLSADFRLEWTPDSLTTLIFRPNLTYGKGEGSSGSYSSKFQSDPLDLVDFPNDYIYDILNDPTWQKIMQNDPLKDIRMNLNDNLSRSETNSLSLNSSLQLTRRFGTSGRNLTFRGTFGLGNNDNESFSDNLIYYSILDPLTLTKRYNTTPGDNWNYSLQMTYSEPIARQTYLQFSYRFQYRYTDSNKQTFDMQDLFPTWSLNDPLPNGYEEALNLDESKDANYRYINHEARVGLRVNREKSMLHLALSFQPQNTKLSYQKGDFKTDTVRHVFNFAPNIDYRYRFDRQSQLRLTYRGQSSQPNMEDLLPISDRSNPLAIREGNPGLKPSFSHNFTMFFNTYNAEKQRGIVAHLNGSVTQNSTTQSTQYTPEGGTISRPTNINGNWDAFGMFGFNTALTNQKFYINTTTNVNFTNNVGYEFVNKQDQRRKTTNMTLGERLEGSYRTTWFDITLDGTLNYNWERNSLRPENNQEPYTYSYGASTNLTLPWNMSISTNIHNQIRRGYSDDSYNTSELIWNAQVAQTFLKGALTLSFQLNDILHNQSNITRSLNALGRSVSESNAINSYGMFHVIYRFNIFGNKEARDMMRQGRRGQGMGPGQPGMMPFGGNARGFSRGGGMRGGGRHGDF